MAIGFRDVFLLNFCSVDGNSRRIPVMLIAAGVLVFLTGCNRGTRPELGVVSGCVIMDGRPLAGVTVVFTPESGGRQSMGITDKSGFYRLKYIRQTEGAKVGAHRVAITKSIGATASGQIPPRYNTQTTLVGNVESGENKIDFSLSSR